jgi:hypothetical protein
LTKKGGGGIMAIKKNEVNAELAELGTTEAGAVNLHKTRSTGVQTTDEPISGPGKVDPRTSK